VGNERSRRIPIRLNFKLEGVERDGEMSADGHYNDLEVFSLLKSEYEQLINQKL
jgi:RimJ/RimL family protein N-acetyltransferase